MQSNAFVLFLSTLAILAAPTVAVFGDHDTLSGKNNVFESFSFQSAEEWNSNQALEDFLEERVKSFIDKDFRLKGSSLAEKLEYLANTDLFPLMDAPLSDRKVLEENIKNLLISYKKEIFAAKTSNDGGIETIVENLVSKVRELVNRHIISVVLETGKVPEKDLNIDLNEVMESVKSTTQEITKNYDQIKTSYAAFLKKVQTDANKSFTKIVFDITADLKSFMNNSSAYLLKAIETLLNDIANETAPLDLAADRMSILVDAAIKNSKNPYEVARFVNSLYWKSISNKEIEIAMKKILAETVSKVFKVLIEKKEADEVSKLLIDLVVVQFLAHGKDNIFISDTYCSYFSKLNESSEISFGTATDTAAEAKVKLLNAIDFLFSLSGCKEISISSDKLKTIVEHLDQIISFDNEQRDNLHHYPQFMKIQDIDVASNYELLHTLQQLYTHFRIENQSLPSEEAVLEGMLDNYLNQVIAPETKTINNDFKKSMQEYSVMLKIMIAMPGKFPEDHVIDFSNLGTNAFTSFTTQFDKCNFVQLKKFVASLFPKAITAEMKFNESDPAAIPSFDNITLAKISSNVKVDENENLDA
jgi:hypothetical protein